MDQFTELQFDDLTEINGGANQEWYDMGKEIGAAAHKAYDAAKSAVSSAYNTVKSWF